MATADENDNSSKGHPYLKSVFEIFEMKKDLNHFKCLLCLPLTNFITACKKFAGQPEKAFLFISR